MVSNIYSVEFEATVHFGAADPVRPLNCFTGYDTFPKPTYVAPMSISITANGTHIESVIKHKTLIILENTNFLKIFLLHNFKSIQKNLKKSYIF